jgi:acetyl/propionyl-CoA carboxylase alpha subunit
LVQEQFRVAAGLPLSFSQDEICLRGAAIECRISAEDPDNRFLPATGTVQALQEPSGPGVRMESSLYPGLQVPLFYDPLLSKLVVWGRDRAQAIARMRRALAEYQIIGVRTTLPFACWLMEHPRFLAADFSTDFIAEEWDERRQGAVVSVEQEENRQEQEAENEALDPEQVSAIISCLLLDERIEREQLLRQSGSSGESGTSRWRAAGWRESVRRL